MNAEPQVAQPPVTGQSPEAERPLQKIVLPGQTPEGEYILGVLLKRTYDITGGGHCVRSEKDAKLIPGDVHYGDPMNSSVKAESDFVPYKLATDVVINATAHAPGGRPVPTLRASVTVGAVRKDIAVFGDRFCTHRIFAGPLFSEPDPFVTMDIRYELAYGGVDIRSDPGMPCAYARNNLGKGFVIGDGKKSLDQLPLPNIEDPDDLLTPARLCAGDVSKWDRQPMPQGFGWFAKFWHPRASYAGIMPADRPAEEELRTMYAAAVPPEQREQYMQAKLPDMDFRFFGGASQGLSLPFLSGDEAVSLLNLAPEGQVGFQLPGERPGIGLDIGRGQQEPEVVLHTVMIRMEERQVDLVWRAAAPYPGPDWLPEMKKMEVLVQ